MSDSELHRSWARVLADEHELICRAHRVPLTAPVIEISRSKRICGWWNARTRTIAISSHLISCHPWAVTVNILKHEMAHQACSELWQSSQPPHGPDFKRACEMLGVPEEYRSAGGELPPVDAGLPGAVDAGGHPLLRKVEKLLALAGSANEHEAALAMSKANELMARHNLLLRAAADSQGYSFVTINRRRKRVEAWQRAIIRILQDFFFVRAIIADSYEPLDDETYKVIELFGRRENVEVARYCYRFLEERINTLWENNRHLFQGRTRTEKNSYHLGLLDGFHGKLRGDERARAERDETAPSPAPRPTSALIVAGDAGLERLIRLRYPRLRTVRRAGPKIYKSTFDQGKEEGKKIVLHRGVTGRRGGKVLKLDI